MKDRPQRLRGHPEWDHARRVTVDNRLHVGTRTIDFAVDESLQIHATTVRIQRCAVEVERQDIVVSDQGRRHVARKQEMPGRLVVARADVSEPVDDRLVVEDSVGDDDLGDEGRIRGGRRHDGILSFRARYWPWLMAIFESLLDCSPCLARIWS